MKAMSHVVRQTLGGNSRGETGKMKFEEETVLRTVVESQNRFDRIGLDSRTDLRPVFVGLFTNSSSTV